MRHLINALAAEILKLKRSLILWIVILVPIIFIFTQSLLFSTKISSYMSKNAWDIISEYTIFFWSLFIMPVLIALITALLNRAEHISQGWKHMFALPAPRSVIYAGKLLTAHGLVIILLIILFLSIPLGVIFLKIVLPKGVSLRGQIPWAANFKSILMLYIGSWFLISIHTMFSWSWKNIAILLGIGIIGTFDAASSFNATIAKFHPWLLDPSVLPLPERWDFTPETLNFAYWYRVICGIFLGMLGCFVFSLRDIK